MKFISIFLHIFNTFILALSYKTSAWLVNRKSLILSTPEHQFRKWNCLNTFFIKRVWCRKKLHLQLKIESLRMKFSVKNFFSKCEHIRRKFWILFFFSKYHSRKTSFFVQCQINKNIRAMPDNRDLDNRLPFTEFIKIALHLPKALYYINIIALRCPWNPSNTCSVVEMSNRL